MAASNLPRLNAPSKEATDQLSARIEEGKKLRNLQMNSDDEMNSAHAQFKKWDEYNCDLIQRLFEMRPENPLYHPASEVDPYFEGHGIWFRGLTPTQWARSFKDAVTDRITILESIVERMGLWDAGHRKGENKRDPGQSHTTGRSVFVVHGHDEETKEKVARFLEKLGLEPIILHEQASKGKTIVEKLENYTTVAYAVVLMTPDDVGGTSKEDLHPRARQNVVFEWGYLIGYLGRDKVCLLYDEQVELPSDMHGIVYEPLDKRDGWRLRLAKEMKSAGLDVDLNKVI